MQVNTTQIFCSPIPESSLQVSLEKSAKSTVNKQSTSQIERVVDQALLSGHPVPINTSYSGKFNITVIDGLIHSSLPKEINRLILSFLDLPELITAMRCSKGFYLFIADSRHQLRKEGIIRNINSKIAAVDEEPNRTSKRLLIEMMDKILINQSPVWMVKEMCELLWDESDQKLCLVNVKEQLLRIIHAALDAGWLIHTIKLLIPVLKKQEQLVELRLKKNLKYLIIETHKIEFHSIIIRAMENKWSLEDIGLLIELLINQGIKFNSSCFLNVIMNIKMGARRYKPLVSFLFDCRCSSDDIKSISKILLNRHLKLNSTKEMTETNPLKKTSSISKLKMRKNFEFLLKHGVEKPNPLHLETYLTREIFAKKPNLDILKQLIDSLMLFDLNLSLINSAYFYQTCAIRCIDSALLGKWEMNKIIKLIHLLGAYFVDHQSLPNCVALLSTAISQQFSIIEIKNLIKTLNIYYELKLSGVGVTKILEAARSTRWLGSDINNLESLLIPYKINLNC